MPDDNQLMGGGQESSVPAAGSDEARHSNLLNALAQAEAQLREVRKLRISEPQEHALKSMEMSQVRSQIQTLREELDRIESNL